MAQEQNDGIQAGASDDATRAEEHVRNAEENRDALEAQSRRTSATAAAAPSSGSPPPRQDGSEPVHRTIEDGLHAAGAGSSGEDTTQAEARERETRANRDALQAQNQRVADSAAPDMG